MRLIALLFAVSALVAAPVSTLAQLALEPLPFVVTDQTLRFVLGSCPEVTGGADVSLGFSETDGGLTVTGTYTASNVDGRLVLTFSGTANNVNAQSIQFVIAGRHTLILNVPELLLGAHVVPAATQVASILSYDASAGLNVYPEHLDLRHPPDYWSYPGPCSFLQPQSRPSSAFLGSEFYVTAHALQQLLDTPPERNSILMGLVGGDEITTSVDIVLSLRVDAISLGTFNESVSYELRYVPEPSTSFTVPAGIGLLAGFARLRGVPLVR